MKKLLSAAAIGAAAFAGSASAQILQPMNPGLPPTAPQTYQPTQTQDYPPDLTMQGPVQPMRQPTYASGPMGTPPWMQDDGSSSDYPIHNPGDRSGERLNREYSGGIYTAPGHGFPAYPGQE